MMFRFCLLAAVLAAITPSCYAQPSTPPPPSVTFGALFRAVQLGRVFPDSKTFADAVPRRPPEAIMADYAREHPEGARLEAFVRDNFTLPNPPALVVSADRHVPIDQHITALWDKLTRQPTPPPPGSSVLFLPASYVVPGGRFREVYYWDSYFTMLGLVADHRRDLVEHMLDDFVDLIERYGRIPNGTRSYYLSRSQPPLFALMLELSTATDRHVRERRLAALRTEYAFWMAGSSCATVGTPCERVVRLPDSTLLNRYYDDRAEARDESYAEDVATAARSDRPAAKTWRDLRAAAESGWDFSSRWLADPQRLTSIRTTAIVPIDLNSLLYAAERHIAAECDALGKRACATHYAAAATRRAAAIHRWLWFEKQARFTDYDWQRRRPTRVLSSATLYPLFTGIATPTEAAAVARTAQDSLLAPYGLRTTAIVTGQQWDAPNGWAPLQWIGTAGLRRYGANALAAKIACRFAGIIARTYDDTGKLLEKYDVEAAQAGGGGEYPTQDGFGWTNGVYRAWSSAGQLAACPKPTL